jgi:thiamine phosphate synthase YjbQ (UPF0047 family)
MPAPPVELNLHLVPRARYDAIDVTDRIARDFGDVLAEYRRVLYCSLHTTAGYLEQGLAARLRDCRDRLDPFIFAFQRVFPHAAGYHHDRMQLRDELSAAQRQVEPKNADAHLTFIGSGLQSCVTYDHRPGLPVFFMDLDGVHRGRARTRSTTVVAYCDEEVVAELSCEVPVSAHAIDSVNLNDQRIGLMEQVREAIGRHGVELGRVDIALDPSESEAALTVNEYETLLMRHDLAEVLADPLRFMARQGRRMLRDPRAVPIKSLGYARYDVVQVINEILDTLGLGSSAVERIVARIMALPAERILRLKRGLSMAVSCDDPAAPAVVRGRYQSPILIQWRASPRRVRTLNITLTRFD